MSCETLKAELATLKAEIAEAQSDGSWDPLELISCVSRFLEITCRTARQAVGMRAEVLEVRDAAVAFYNETIMPLDIPGVPEFAEGFLDATLSNAIFQSLTHWSQQRPA